MPKSEHLDALWRLTKLVADAKYEGNFLRRLFVMYQPNVSQAENIAGILRFTKKQKEIFIRWAKIEINPDNISTPMARLKFIYRYGKQFTIDKILLSAAIYLHLVLNINEVLKEVENAVVPIFPLRGKDIVNRGINSDKEIGATLHKLEQIWIDSDFNLTRDELLNKI